MVPLSLNATISVIPTGFLEHEWLLPRPCCPFLCKVQETPLITSSSSGLSTLDSPQKTGMNRAPCLGNANIFIILPRHRTLALHWHVFSSLEAGHMLEPTPSCRWWIVKQGNTQMLLHGNPVEEQWPQINLLEPRMSLSSPEMLHNLHCERWYKCSFPRKPAWAEPCQLTFH